MKVCCFIQGFGGSNIIFFHRKFFIMLKYILWFIGFFVFIPAIAYSADINGLYPPIEIEPEFFTPRGMVSVKGGCFNMGETFGEGVHDERPVHEVCVDTFYMGKYEVTQKEWTAVMGSNPSYFKGGFFGCGRCPVESVSWHDVQEYIKKLNRKTGRHYRLPTEAEWEYAARERGRSVRFGTGKDTIGADEANFDASKESDESYSRAGVDRAKTMPVGSFASNALGLYDMSGNVWEWIGDWYGGDYYSRSPRNNPKGPSGGSDRVIRGGSWDYGPRGVRAAIRSYGSSSEVGLGIGFRLVVGSSSGR